RAPVPRRLLNGVRAVQFRTAGWGRQRRGIVRGGRAPALWATLRVAAANGGRGYIGPGREPVARCTSGRGSDALRGPRNGRRIVSHASRRASAFGGAGAGALEGRAMGAEGRA